jgi:hypothetical protein
MNQLKKVFSVYGLLWAIYISFLAVLLPHTAWTFSQFQKDPNAPQPWLLAFAFETVIAAVTHKLAERITKTPKRLSERQKFVHRYLNGYSAVLVASLLISSLTNLAYTVQFAPVLDVFASWGISVKVYEFAFGAALPFLSFGFALILSDMTDAELEADPALTQANENLREVRRQLREAEQARTQAEQGRKKAEERFEAAGDLMKAFMADDKKARVIAIHQQWPELPNNAIAIMADSSPAHVSETLKAFSKN